MYVKYIQRVSSVLVLIPWDVAGVGESVLYRKIVTVIQDGLGSLVHQLLIG
jgi:hypothetical protein